MHLILNLNSSSRLLKACRMKVKLLSIKILTTMFSLKGRNGVKNNKRWQLRSIDIRSLTEIYTVVKHGTSLFNDGEIYSIYLCCCFLYHRSPDCKAESRLQPVIFQIRRMNPNIYNPHLQPTSIYVSLKHDREHWICGPQKDNENVLSFSD